MAKTDIKRGPTDPERLADLIIEQYKHTLRFFRGEFWQYQSGVYVTISTEAMTAQINLTAQSEVDRAARVAQKSKKAPVAQSVTRNIVSDALAKLKARTLVHGEKMPLWIGEDEDRRQLICLQDGLMDVSRPVSKLKLLDHTPDWFNAIQLPYPGAFDEGISDETGETENYFVICPKWKQFLDDALEADQERIAILQEFFGYALIPDTRYEKFLLLLGNGSNGKSVVLAVLTDLVGEKNVSNIPLDILFERFQAAHTVNKLLNVIAETEDRKKLSVGQFKAFVSGDRMYADRKGIGGIDFRPTARLVIASNKFPELSDESSALWRRAIVMPFNKVVEDSKRDPDLTNKLRTELPGIFHWALRGLERLKQQKRFSTAVECESALVRYRKQRDPIGAFLREQCIAAGTFNRVMCAELHKRFQEWADSVDDKNFDPIKSAPDLRRIQTIFPSVEREQRRVNGRQIWHYTGLLLKDTDEINLIH